jgi:photosystem II stability/assembly factor-like uncharacterized protein
VLPPTGLVYSVDAFVPDPRTPRRIFARTSDDLWLSEDGGATWRDSTNGLRGDRDSLFNVAIAPSRPTTMYGAVSFGVSRSLDGGASWQPTVRLPAGNGVNGSLVVDPTNPEVAYGGSTQSVLKTTDGGQSWRRIWTELAIGSHLGPIAIDPTNPSTLYAGANSTYPSPSAIVKSTDAGESWTVITEGPVVVGLTIDPRDARRIYAGTGAGALLSTDAGVTWKPFGEPTAPGTPIYTINVHPKAPRPAYAVAYSRGVMRLTFEPPGAFHCYALRRAAALDARPTLAIQLDASFAARVRAPRQLCLPAAVDGDDREAPTDGSRLIGYDIRAVAPAP